MPKDSKKAAEALRKLKKPVKKPKLPASESPATIKVIDRTKD